MRQKMTPRQKAGQKGGKATARKHDSAHYENIGRRGGLMCRTLYSSAFYSSIRKPK